MKAISKQFDLDYEYYQEIIMEKHKEKLMSDRRQEIEQLKKRIKYLEQELEGMGVIIGK